MADGLYLEDGSFLPFKGEDLTTELATRENAGAWLSGVGLWLDQLPDPDPVLRKRGDDAAILTELSADDQVTVAMLSRKNRVLNCPHYGFRAGAPDGEQATPEAEELYRRFAKDLERTNLRTVISGMLDAPFYGYTPLELLWRPGPDGWWHMVDVVPRPYHWFAFDAENKPIFRGEWGAALYDERLRTLPPGKFVFVSHHASYDNPYGLRLLSRCLWPVAFKKGGLQFYARFAEKYGQPWLVLKAPSKATKLEKRDMAGDLSRMVRDCLAVIPYGSEMEFLTAGSMQTDLHERFIARQDRSISKLLMGQTLTVELEGRNNSQAASTVHEDVAEGLADADKAMVADGWNEIAWLYARVNAGPEVLAPLFSYEEPEDLSARADLDKKLWDMGVRFKPEHFADNYNLKPEEFSIQEATPSVPGFNFAAPAPRRIAAVDARKRAEPANGHGADAPPSGRPVHQRAQATFDAALETMLPDAVKASGPFRKKIENAINMATSPDDLQLRLADLLAPSVTPDELETFMARSMTAAAGFGATAVHGEGVEDAARDGGEPRSGSAAKAAPFASDSPSPAGRGGGRHGDA